MKRAGRIEGRMSDDGQFYELVQKGEVRSRYPIEEARQRFHEVARRNGWGPLA